MIDEAHNLESKVRNSYTMEVNYISLCRTIEQARKIARGLGNTIDRKIKEYYKYLDKVFDVLSQQVKEQDELAKRMTEKLKDIMLIEIYWHYRE